VLVAADGAIMAGPHGATPPILDGSANRFGKKKSESRSPTTLRFTTVPNRDEGLSRPDRRSGTKSATSAPGFSAHRFLHEFPIFASSAAVSFFSAKAVGHMWHSSGFLGADPSTYAFFRVTTQANIYRIGVP
jgi:hypothetical protein